MKTTVVVLNKYRLVYNSVFFKQYVVYKSIVLSKYRLLYTMYMVRSYMESDSVLVADGNITSAVSPTRRGARSKYVWSAESPTQRLCLR